ncbi:MAG: hypothetical protein IT385_06525 [Deltaproteobacteria bacterium]|nr:hypothetical protein [Deltaproteobacteria bacterium]
MRAALVLAALGSACRSAPETTRALVRPDDPFVACVAPHRVEVARDEAGAAIVRPLGATPRELSGLAEAAARCGPWALDDAAPAHVRALVAHEACAPDCSPGWEPGLARAIARAPTTATRCEVVPDESWGAWARATLLDEPGLGIEAWVDRAITLGRAGVGTPEEHIEARLAEAGPEEAAALARASVPRLPFGAESLRFKAALALVRAGDTTLGRDWLNQIAGRGQTAFRAFARAELERLDAASEAPR